MTLNLDKFWKGVALGSAKELIIPRMPQTLGSSPPPSVAQNAPMDADNIHQGLTTQPESYIVVQKHYTLNAV